METNLYCSKQVTYSSVERPDCWQQLGLSVYHVCIHGLIGKCLAAKCAEHTNPCAEILTQHWRAKFPVSLGLMAANIALAEEMVPR